MNDAAFERRLQEWLVDREPGPVPASLRESAALVPLDTPIPAAARVWGAIVGRRRDAASGSPVRFVFVLIVIGLLIAVIAAGLSAGSRKVPLSAWGDYVVGQPAPDRDFGSLAGVVPVGEPTISIDDRVDAEFVLYIPGDASPDRTAADASVLIEASNRVSSSTAFLVIVQPSSPLPQATVDRLHGAGMLTAEPPADWPSGASPHGEPALVITNRRGEVAHVYVGELPAAEALIGDLDRASVR
jgi:hypothetical protein